MHDNSKVNVLSIFRNKDGCFISHPVMCPLSPFFLHRSLRSPLPPSLRELAWRWEKDGYHETGLRFNMFDFDITGEANVFPSIVIRFDGLCRSEEHTSELQSLAYLVCRLLLEKKKQQLRAARPLPAR